MTAVWLSPQARERLESELAGLVSHRDIEPSADDYDDQLIDTWLTRKARIRELHDLLSAARRDAGFPPDDGVVEPGMVLTVRYTGTGDTETFLLGARGAEEIGIEVYSPSSPLGRALLGATPGEHRDYQLPDGSPARVRLLAAVPLGIWMTPDRA